MLTEKHSIKAKKKKLVQGTLKVRVSMLAGILFCRLLKISVYRQQKNTIRGGALESPEGNTRSYSR